ncbi:cysteine desulfurase NifS [Clostridium sp. 'deep sea']|uniref:cysteine desulfurase NifS n=1 Tax=Clostridium sp. 'deep sea' TaxID=2779445 RepID=UPI00189695C5|nr:cysteine desulfurase NifS [Clostridium sp. 'deep sea']QOR34281.1 cysteine desulfurase NifS [Clostridium sp. 'deep sea']
MRNVYLDHSATTPLRKEVLEAMIPFYTETWGNPSSIHKWGREVRIAVENAREQIATLIGANARELFFTGGGTESDNIAILGTAEAKKHKGKHIITSQIEHHGVLDTCHYLQKQGFDVTYIPVDEFGLVNPQDVKDAIREDTILVTLMLANNEVGTIQPIKEISKYTREAGVWLHTDAVQAVGSIPVNVDDLGVDMLTFSAHKFYGPKGIGALYTRKGVRPKPVVHGGGQERKVRPGTENVAGIVGMAKALELAVKELNETQARLTGLRDRLITGIKESIPAVILNGHATKRLPGNANMSFLYVEGESIILSLDLVGIAVSSGSACTSGSLDPSHVLMSMGMDHQQAHGSLRMTLGKGTTDEDIDYVLQQLPPIINKLREMSPLYIKNIKEMENL